MKNFLLLFCTVLLSAGAAAQSGFFIQPSFGAGISNVQRSQSLNIVAGTTTDDKTVQAINYKLGIGYRFKKWQLLTGLNYISTSYKQFDGGGYYGSYTVGPYGVSYNTSSIKNGLFYNPVVYQTITDYFLLVPFVVSYRINLLHKLSLLPSVGFELACNINEQQSDNGGPGKTMSATEFDNKYKSVGVWGMAGVAAQYAVNKKLLIHIGPEAHFMLTSMLKHTDYGSYHATQYNNAYLLNAGITWQLNKRITEIKKAQGTKPK